MKIIKNILVLFLITINISAKEAIDLIPDALDFKSLEKLETQMKDWTTQVGEKDLVKISNMSQRPQEVEVIQFLFPHLLPDNYNGKSIYLNCFHYFSKVKEEKSKKSFQQWEDCIRYDFRQPEDFMIKTFNGLKKNLK